MNVYLAGGEGYRDLLFRERVNMGGILSGEDIPRCGRRLLILSIHSSGSRERAI